jgi:CRP/FNR family transcriptional regulator, cyclic AMP receptor protein
MPIIPHLRNAPEQSRSVLADVQIFRGLPDKELKQLERLGRERVYQPGDAIVTEGSTGVALFVILHGKVRITQRAGEGQERELRTLGPGESFGEMALFNNRPRSATVSAIEPTTCIAIHQFDFFEELRKNPEIGIRMLDALSQRLVDAERR